jgi:hypothetical protein
LSPASVGWRKPDALTDEHHDGEQRTFHREGDSQSVAQPAGPENIAGAFLSTREDREMGHACLSDGRSNRCRDSGAVPGMAVALLVEEMGR